MERTNARTLTAATPARAGRPRRRSTSRSSRSRWSSARSPRRSAPRRPRSSRWSSRSSRPAAAGPTTASSATRRSIARSSSGRRRRARRLGLGTRAVIASPIIGPEGNREFLVHLAPGPGLRRDRRADRRGHRPMTVGPHRLRLQPDDRGGDRAERARRRLVPGARHRRSGSAQSGDLDALCRASCRRPTSWSCSAATARSCARRGRSTEVDVPLLGINLGKVGFLSKAEAGELEAVLGHDRRRRVTRSTSGWRSRAGSCAAASAIDGDRHVALNDVVIARGVAGPGRAGSTSRSTTRTSRRSSPTASSSPARPARPATRSRPAARSSTRSAAT